jgi:hypothetical protein
VCPSASRMFGSAPRLEFATRPVAQQVRATIEGCISGKRLIPSLTSSRPFEEVLLNASDFILDGPRELMKQLQSSHDGHLERITGIATIPQPEGTTVETYGGTKGKTRVTSGVRVSEAGGEAPLPVKLRVQSAEHLADECAPKR